MYSDREQYTYMRAGLVAPLDRIPAGFSLVSDIAYIHPQNRLAGALIINKVGLYYSYSYQGIISVPQRDATYFADKYGNKKEG